MCGPGCTLTKRNGSKIYRLLQSKIRSTLLEVVDIPFMQRSSVPEVVVTR